MGFLAGDVNSEIWSCAARMNGSVRFGTVRYSYVDIEARVQQGIDYDASADGGFSGAHNALVYIDDNVASNSRRRCSTLRCEKREAGGS